MISPTSFAGALSLTLAVLLCASESTSAAPTSTSTTTSSTSMQKLTEVAEEAAKIIPELRAADSKRKTRLLRDFAAASTSSDTSRGLGYNGGDDDDYNNANWKYQYNEDMSASDFGFDVDSYSFKYTGCSTVQTFSDELSYYGQDSVLASKRFATFRLCPQRTCSDRNYEGCSSNYGDYVVSMDQFLAAMVSLNEERVTGYCEYCEQCAAIESFHKFYYETTSHKTAVASMAEQTYQTWLQNYYDAQGYDSSNGYGQNSAALEYYQSIQSNKNYANDYTSNYGYSSSSSSSSSSGYNSGSSYSQWANSQQFWDAGQSSSNYNGWKDMGQSYGSWYGKQVVNGHYYNGQFVQEWGYFRDDGEFMSLEEDGVEWDEYIYGEYPSTWDEDWANATASDVQSCNYQYASSCSNQYESCMRIMQNEDYMAYMAYMQSRYNGQYMTNSLRDFVECTQVDEDYITAYQQYLKWETQMDAQYQQQNGNINYAKCNGDDDNCYAQYQQNTNNNNNDDDNGNANKYGNMDLYIGPHCGEDGKSITLGVYTDSSCSNYASQYSVKDILGVDVMKQHSGGSIDLFPENCISCVAEEQDQWYEDEQADGYAANGISPICSMLYQYAGKCHKNLKSSSSSNSQNQYYDQTYQSSAQEENEDAVCNFIEVIRSNTYNEKGQITFGFSNIWSNQGFRSGARAMGPLHKAGLWVFGVGVGVLIVSAVYLQQQLSEHSISWRPRRFARGGVSVVTSGSENFIYERSDAGITRDRSEPRGYLS